MVLTGTRGSLLYRTGLVALVLVTATLAPSGPAQAAEETFGFEDGTFEGWSTGEKCGEGNFAVVDSPVRSGQHAAMVKVDAGECGGKTVRAEFSRTDKGSKGAERWYAWSFFVPADVETDPDFWIFWQLHQKPGGGPWTRPPLTGRIRGDGLEVRNDWKTSQGETGDKSWKYGQLERGVWHDMVVHAKWSGDADGQLEVWQDGELIVEKQGANMFAGAGDIFLKFGVYKGSDSPNSVDKTIYYDDIRVSDAPIAPGSGTTEGEAPAAPDADPSEMASVVPSEDVAETTDSDDEGPDPVMPDPATPDAVTADAVTPEVPEEDLGMLESLLARLAELLDRLTALAGTGSSG
jgi:hypothetical protein